MNGRNWNVQYAYKMKVGFWMKGNGTMPAVYNPWHILNNLMKQLELRHSIWLDKVVENTSPSLIPQENDKSYYTLGDVKVMQTLPLFENFSCSL